jgi:hypothetical protein
MPHDLVGTNNPHGVSPSDPAVITMFVGRRPSSAGAGEGSRAMSVDFDWIPDTARARPFVVQCPSCDGRGCPAAKQDSGRLDACWLCCGHGSVARVVAERYERAREAKD